MSTTTASTTTFSLDGRVAEAIRSKLLERAGAGSYDAKPVVEAPKAVEVLVGPIKLEDNQKLASQVLGLKKGQYKEEHDFACTILDKSTVAPEVVAMVPSLDPDYKPQPEEALRLLRAIEDGDKTLITGPTGSGKSSLVRYICALTNRPFIRINMTEDTESSTVFGTVTMKSGTMHFEDGPATEAVKYGAVMLIDEWELMTPGITMGLQWLFEDDGMLYLKEMPGTSSDKLIKPHANFRLVCAGNTVGQGDDTGSHAGTNVQNTATIDRFSTTIVLGYLDAKHETAILTKKFPKLDKTIIANMLKVAALVRQANGQGAVTLTMSPRTLINWSRKILSWGDPKLAFTIAFLDKLRESDRKVVTELYGKVFGR
jgi:cobaltochelatase CobS